MKKVIGTLFQLIFISCLGLTAVHCGVETTPFTDEIDQRGSTGKADAAGSCAGSDCSGKGTSGNCFCDPTCVQNGDCCSDMVKVCGAPPKLDYKSYDVVFSNPLCQQYDYPQPIATADGKGTRNGKPKNVYCSSADSQVSGSRPTTPQSRLVKWISGLNQGDEIFLAYLSYSNSIVGAQLCDAAKRGVKVTMVLDAVTDQSKKLVESGGTVLLRGHKGGIQYAHNKVILINANQAGPGDEDADYMRMTFSSGNMSSGVVLHHENWHFIEVKRDSYFAQAHKCLMNAQVDEDASSSIANYTEYLNNCRANIPYPKESDIQLFFTPNKDDSKAVVSVLVNAIKVAKTVDIGVHRFALSEMINALSNRLYADKTFKVRLVADDDLYWLKPLVGTGHQTGPNMEFEAYNVERLFEAGDYGMRFNVKYMETNHGGTLLHHNKFLIYSGMTGRPDAVLCGAANLTGAGFKSNFENIYFVTIPEVVSAFRTQYARFWDGQKASPDEEDPPQATTPENMPAEDQPAKPVVK